jgi:GT2 family glycosyltransferase
VNRAGSSDHEKLPRPICSVVIPTYNGRELVERCLASVERNRPTTAGLDIEIIVADDGSTDGTAHWLASERPAVRVVRSERNGGFCAAANAGMASARGDFIQILNNDTEVAPGWIEKGLEPFADVTVGAVAPLVLVRADPQRVDSAGDAYAWVGWPMKRGHGEPTAKWAGRPVEEVFGASGTGAFYRASALAKVGTFDPIYGSYYEDIDLSFRLRWAGFRCVFASGAMLYHDVSASYDHRAAALQRRMARNAELVFWSNLPARVLAYSVVPHLLFVFAQGAWRLARGRLMPFLQGKLDAVRSVRAIVERRKVRREFTKRCRNRPHLLLSGGSVRDVRNHLRRVRENSAAQ